MHSPKDEASTKKGGKLILTTCFIFPLHDIPNDYYRFTKYGLRHLFTDWEILELKEATDTLTAIAVLLQRIGYQYKILKFKPFKLFFLALVKLISPLSFIIIKEFVDISKKTSRKKYHYQQILFSLPKEIILPIAKNLNLCKNKKALRVLEFICQKEF